jgi:hypothetical protein
MARISRCTGSTPPLDLGTDAPGAGAEAAARLGPVLKIESAPLVLVPGAARVAHRRTMLPLSMMMRCMPSIAIVANICCRCRAICRLASGASCSAVRASIDSSGPMPNPCAAFALPACGARWGQCPRIKDSASPPPNTSVLAAAQLSRPSETAARCSSRAASQTSRHCGTLAHHVGTAARDPRSCGE